MKKLFFSLLLLIASGLNAYTIEDLEQQIIESNTEEVQKILNNVQLDLNEHSRLLILADDIEEQRKTKYEGHFNTNKSISILFELSKNKILTILSGLGLIIASYLADSSIRISMKNFGPIDYVDFCLLPMEMPRFGFYYNRVCRSIGLFGGGAIIATFIKHFYEIKKLYDNSIVIKQLILKIRITND